ncbi:hypothetical protein [Ochrobactrum sp. 3-3]|uniref:hypothetical protein n=1 Tax=Ochrobactrum sp. 3-3 TaxID=1830124 RepID=UPI000DEEC275|nr:hypothetical protein [Ochrobactrum sp. 3-3]
MTTLPEEAVKAYIKAFGNTPRTKAMALKNEQKVRHALTAALPFLPVQGAVKKLDLTVLERLAEYAEQYDHPDDNGPFPDIQDAMVTVGDLRQARKLLSFLSALEPSAAPVQVFGNSEQLKSATDMGNPITDKTVKRRVADALESVWSALDCDVDQIERVITHMRANGLRIVETVVPVSDEVDSTEVGNPATEPSTASKMEVVAETGIPATEPSAARELALEEAAQVIDAKAEEYEKEARDLRGSDRDRRFCSVVAVRLRGSANERRALSSPDHAESERTQCERCQGNGEIVTDWERYRHPHENDVGDEAVAECPDCSGEGYIEASPDHADDLAVDRFAIAMKQKLAKKREEGRGGWGNKDECSAEYLSYLLIQHIWKGDPVDIANLAMMLQQRGERVVIDSETSSIIPDHADAGRAQARDVLARFRDYVIEGITAGTIMRGGEHHNPIWQEVASILHADAGIRTTHPSGGDRHGE